LNFGTIDQIEENPNTGNHLYLHVSYSFFFCLFGGGVCRVKSKMHEYPQSNTHIQERLLGMRKKSKKEYEKVKDSSRSCF